MSEHFENVDVYNDEKNYMKMEEESLKFYE